MRSGVNGYYGKQNITIGQELYFIGLTTTDSSIVPINATFSISGSEAATGTFSGTMIVFSFVHTYFEQTGTAENAVIDLDASTYIDSSLSAPVSIDILTQIVNGIFYVTSNSGGPTGYYYYLGTITSNSIDVQTTGPEYAGLCVLTTTKAYPSWTAASVSNTNINGPEIYDFGPYATTITIFQFIPLAG